MERGGKALLPNSQVRAWQSHLATMITTMALNAKTLRNCFTRWVLLSLILMPPGWQKWILLAAIAATGRARTTGDRLNLQTRLRGCDCA